MRIQALLCVPLAGFAVVGVATAALAATPPAPNPYVDECGSCHVAYPPHLLSTPEWRRVLGDLRHHFGVDASLDSGTLQAVGRRLGVTQVAKPGTTAALPRITAKPWFREEHDEVGSATFRSPAVKSAANCSACHAGAERGDYDEDTVRIPRVSR